MSAVRSATADVFIRLFSSPNRSVIAATTGAPRVFFGSSATFNPDGSVDRVVRDSMLAGAGSKASPAATAVSPL